MVARARDVNDTKLKVMGQHTVFEECFRTQIPRGQNGLIVALHKLMPLNLKLHYECETFTECH